MKVNGLFYNKSVYIFINLQPIRFLKSISLAIFLSLFPDQVMEKKTRDNILVNILYFTFYRVMPSCNVDYIYKEFHIFQTLRTIVSFC